MPMRFSIAERGAGGAGRTGQEKLPLASPAKREEELWRPGWDDPVRLDPPEVPAQQDARVRAGE